MRMARTTPLVEHMRLAPTGDDSPTVAVGTPAWFAWLEAATIFAFRGEQGSFTARKERAGRGGVYWKAYRKRDGKLRHAYLGKSTELTRDNLRATAAKLAARFEPTVPAAPLSPLDARPPPAEAL